MVGDGVYVRLHLTAPLLLPRRTRTARTAIFISSADESQAWPLSGWRKWTYERERIEKQKHKALENEQRFQNSKANFLRWHSLWRTVQPNTGIGKWLWNFWKREPHHAPHCVYSKRIPPNRQSNTFRSYRRQTGRNDRSTLQNAEKVLQAKSRGYAQNTEYHDRIIKLVNKNNASNCKRMAA